MKISKSKTSLILIIAILCLSFVAAIRTQEGSGDIEKGAQLYYSWDWFLDYGPTISTNPLWTNGEISGIETWRCVSCHGWDYSGDAGNGVPGLMPAKEMSNEEIFGWLDGSENVDHDFSDFFTVSGFRDLTVFIKLGVEDYSEVFRNGEIVYSDIDIEMGEVLYKDECLECHSVDGSKINFGSAENPIFIGDIGYENPQKLFHLVRFGHLEVETDAEKSLGWSIKDSISLVGYTKYLPRGKGDGAILLDDIDYDAQGETTDITYLSIVLTVIPFLGILANKIRNERDNSQPES